MTEEAPQAITSVAVYRSREPLAPVTLADISDSIVLIHSPRAARRFAELADERQLDRSTIAIAAISRAAAEAAGSGWGMIEVAESPTDEALLEVAVRASVVDWGSRWN